MNIKRLALTCLLTAFCSTTAQAASTLVVTTWGHTSTLNSTDGYNFEATTVGDRFIRFVVSKPEGETWAILLGVPQGQVLANGFYEPIPGNDSFDAYPNMWGAGFSIAGTDPFTGAMGGANTTSGSFALSALQLTGNTVDAFRLDFDVRANGRQTGYAEFNIAAVPEPGSTLALFALGIGALVIHRRKTS